MSFTATQHHSFLSGLLHVFMNPLTLILVIAAAAWAFLGDKVDAGIIGVIVLLSGAIDLSQTYRSERAVEQLRDRVAPTATALRNGEWKKIKRRDVVPGDIVRLSAGDLVPANARLLIARDIYVQQGMLTGESLPTDKEATGEPASAKADARNMVFLGTSIVSGTATAEVVATGAGLPLAILRLASPHARKRQPSIRACEISASSSRERSSSLYSSSLSSALHATAIRFNL